MTGKNLLGITWRAMLVAVWMGSTSTVAADWESTSTVGGSMKRDLFDVNNDGWLDSLSVNTWYKNPKSWTGTWNPIATGWNTEIWRDSYQVGHANMASYVDAKRAGDINGDGLPDMVVGTYGYDAAKGVPENMRDSIYAAINPGNEGIWSFYYIGKLPGNTEDGVETVAIGDMNNDGRPDILAGGECKELRWYINPGSAMSSNWGYKTLDKDFTNHFWDGHPDVEGMAIGHFNDDDNDGVCGDADDYLDVAVTTCSPLGLCGGTYVLINNDKGGTPTGDWDRITLSEGVGEGWTGVPFFPYIAPAHPADGRYSCTESITEGDINGDEWDDVILTDHRPYHPDGSNPAGDTRIYWYENSQGSGDWTQHEVALLSDDCLKGYNPEVVDVDKDGDLDIICYHADDGATYWYENINGTFDNKHRICGGAIDNNAVGDVDGDGDPDIINNGLWYRNPTNVIPEPSTIALLLSGIVCLAALAVRRKLKCR